MQRLYPKTIQNRVFLSRLLEYYLATIEDSPYELTLRNLAWDTEIPEAVWLRLMRYYRTPADAEVITAYDFHIAFANVMVHYPTVKMWWEADGNVYISV